MLKSSQKLGDLKAPDSVHADLWFILHVREKEKSMLKLDGQNVSCRASVVRTTATLTVLI